MKVWRETEKGTWQLAHEVKMAASVQCVSWAPSEYGKLLVAGSSDGTLLALRCRDDRWTSLIRNKAHVPSRRLGLTTGVRALSWAPAGTTLFEGENLIETRTMNIAVPRFATVSSDDNHLREWSIEGDVISEIASAKAASEGDFVSDVAWNRALGSISDVIATSTELTGVELWQLNSQEPGQPVNLKSL